MYPYIRCSYLITCLPSHGGTTASVGSVNVFCFRGPRNSTIFIIYLQSTSTRFNVCYMWPSLHQCPDRRECLITCFPLKGFLGGGGSGGGATARDAAIYELAGLIFCSTISVLEEAKHCLSKGQKDS